MVSGLLATAATVVYTATLYPGINRGLTLRTPIQFLSKFRQQIGISSCLLGCIHAGYIALFTDHRQLNITSGVICLVIFILLGVTSNRWSQRNLGKYWKRLHALTYALPILLLWHVTSKMDTWSFFTRLNIFLMVSVLSTTVFRIVNKTWKLLHFVNQASTWLRSLR